MRDVPFKRYCRRKKERKIEREREREREREMVKERKISFRRRSFSIPFVALTTVDVTESPGRKMQFSFGKWNTTSSLLSERVIRVIRLRNTR